MKLTNTCKWKRKFIDTENIEDHGKLYFPEEKISSVASQWLLVLARQSKF